MNDKFDELAKCVARSVTRAFLCLTVAVQFSGATYAEDLYVDVAAVPNGAGSLAHPYWRITDAVVRARNDRRNAVIPAAEPIIIHVAAGTYRGSYDALKLEANPQWEMLPIILNVPNLTLSGATVLDTDAQGLPTGIRPGPETTLTTPDSQLFAPRAALILITRTTDGGVGDRVTVTGFDLKQKQGGSADFNTCGVYVDRVSGFAIRNNAFVHTPAGLLTRLASGVVEGNLLKCYAYGVFISGGSIAQPAVVTVSGNRATDHMAGGMILGGSAAMPSLDLGANTVSPPPLQTSFNRNDPQDQQNIPDTLATVLTGNDISDNGHFGVRIWAYPPAIYANTDPTQPLTAVLHATVTGNSFSRNGDHGVWVDAGWPTRGLPSPLTADLAVAFKDNTYVGNGRTPVLFSFSAAWLSIGLGDIQLDGFLNQSAYQITVADGELAGYDYDNPTADAFTGASLGNTLVVNGSSIPPGTKVTSLKK